MARSKLYCFYVSSTSMWLSLGPMKVQMNSNDMFHAEIKELLYGSECDKLKAPLAKQLYNHRDTLPKLLQSHSAQWTDVRVMKK